MVENDNNDDIKLPDNASEWFTWKLSNLISNPSSMKQIASPRPAISLQTVSMPPRISNASAMSSLSRAQISNALVIICICLKFLNLSRFLYVFNSF